MDVPLAVRIVLVVALCGSGGLILWMARAAASGRLRRNDLAGIRIPSTLASDEAWLAAHVRAERPTRWGGVIAMVTGVAALLPVPAPVLCGVVLLGCAAILVCTLYGAQVGRRAAVAVAAPSGDPSGAGDAPPQSSV